MNTRLNIVADDNIPLARELFEPLGNLALYPGRTITREHLKQADCLVIRSITKVNAALLEGTPVKFVGTATAGSDHFDTAWLKTQGIAFTSSHGCNSRAVAEYFATALVTMAARRGISLKGKTCGVIGVGHVGSKVVKMARALGMNVVKNDPPLEEAMADPSYRPIAEAVACDVVTLHVPLTRGGPWPTWRMADRSFFNAMKPGALFFNASRGAVLDTPSLIEAVRANNLNGLVLDVFEDEPRVDPELLRIADIATPHVAGYSIEGRIRGTQMVYSAACDFFNIPPSPDLDAICAVEGGIPIECDDDDRPIEELLSVILNKACPVERDSGTLKQTAELPPDERARVFDSLRKNYPERREFGGFALRLRRGRPDLILAAQALGFNVTTVI